MSNGEYIELGTLANLRAGQTFKAGLENDPMGKLAVLLPKDIADGELLDTYIRVNQNTVPSLDSHLLKKGDIIIANKGTRFSTFLYNNSPDYAVVTTAFYVISPYKMVLPEYLNWYLSQAEVKDYFLSSITGSVIPSINKTILSELPIPVIPLEEQHYICDFMKKTSEEQMLLKGLLSKREAFSRSYIWERIKKSMP